MAKRLRDYEALLKALSGGESVRLVLEYATGTYEVRMDETFVSKLGESVHAFHG